MITKDDLMKLPKERLAELLAEYINEKESIVLPNTTPYIPSPSIPTYPWITYETNCTNGGKCTNPFRDCINCPGRFTTDGGLSTNEVKK